MEEYKFVNVTKLAAALTYTANKIRAKLGSNSKLDFDLEGETGFGDPVDDIQVGITPSGSIELNANGTYDVTEKASAVVAVPQPTGSVEITANGTYDVTEKASAVVNVPSSGITPSGTKEITITENGTTTEDVTSYAAAQITVNVPSGGGESGALVGSGTFSPSADTTTLSVDVGGEFDLFIFRAVSSPLGNGKRVTGGGVYDKTAGLRVLYLSSNNSGSTWTNSALNTAWTPPSGNVMTVTTDNLIAGIVYQWYAFKR